MRDQSHRYLPEGKQVTQNKKGTDAALPLRRVVNIKTGIWDYQLIKDAPHSGALSGTEVSTDKLASRICSVLYRSVVFEYHSSSSNHEGITFHRAATI